MHDSRRPAILVTLLALGAGTAACEQKTPLGSSGSPEAYLVRMLNAPASSQTVENVVGGYPGGSEAQPAWLVRVASNEHSIRGIAVSDQYLYFVAWWEGLYRVPKTGGPVEVVEAGKQTLFEPATATGNAVYWARSTFDKDDYPHVQIRRRLDDGSPSQLLFDGDWGVTSSGQLLNFQADDSGVYMIAGRAGAFGYNLHRVAPGGGQMQPVVTLPGLRWPSWLLQPEGLYLADCGLGGPDCPVTLVAKDGDGARLPVATLEVAFAELHAADADNLYLLGSGVWKLPKQGGTPVQLVPAGEPGRGSRFLLVDDTNVYFSTGSGNGIQLHALPKAGGPATLLGDGIVLRDVMHIVHDRDRFYLLRGNGGGEGAEISVVSKR